MTLYWDISLLNTRLIPFTDSIPFFCHELIDFIILLLIIIIIQLLCQTHTSLFFTEKLDWTYSLCYRIDFDSWLMCIKSSSSLVICTCMYSSLYLLVRRVLNVKQTSTNMKEVLYFFHSWTLIKDAKTFQWKMSL